MFAVLKNVKFKSPKTYSGKAFDGILLEPIMIPHYPDLTFTDLEKDKELIAIQKIIRDEANEQFGKRIAALAMHYEIDIGNDDNASAFFKIIKALACDFLPGFQLNLNRAETRPRGSYTVGGAALFEAVNKRVTDKNKTISEACQFLSRHGTGKFRNAGAASLETAYYRFKANALHSLEFFETHPVYSELIRILGFDELHNQIEKKYQKIKT